MGQQEVDAIHKETEDAILESRNADAMLRDMNNKLKAGIDTETSLRQKLEEKVLKEIEPELKALSRIVFDLKKKVAKEGNDPMQQRVQKLESLFSERFNDSLRQRVQRLESRFNEMYSLD